MKLFNWMNTILYGLTGHFVIKPLFSELYKLTPTKNIILFIGRDKGLFLDNVKYLFLYVFKNKTKINLNFDIYFLTEDNQTYLELKKKNLPVVKYPSFSAFKLFLTSKILIVDNTHWIKNFKVFLSSNLIKIQLWHGVGFKYIELLNKKEFLNFKKKIYNWLIYRFPYYDIVISTSPFYTENVFSKSFKTKEIWEVGYPRNDIFFRNLEQLDLINVDVKLLEKVIFLKKKGYKVIVYAPTFRDSRQKLDLNLNLSSFLKKEKILLIVKPHPNLDINFSTKDFNICIYPSNKDIYPILKFADCLITDYSSIYMDFLLLDKPIIFFPFDLDSYLNKDREFQFDYNWITPGEKVFNIKDLIKVLYKTCIQGKDKFRKERKKIRDMAFKYQDGKASERIFTKILSKLLS